MATGQELMDALAVAVARETTVDASAAALIDGFAAAQQAAIDAALAGGLTPAQLEPFQANLDAMKASQDKLEASVAANTPAAAAKRSR